MPPSPVSHLQDYVGAMRGAIDSAWRDAETAVVSVCPQWLLPGQGQAHVIRDHRRNADGIRQVPRRIQSQAPPIMVAALTATCPGSRSRTSCPAPTRPPPSSHTRNERPRDHPPGLQHNCPGRTVMRITNSLQPLFDLSRSARFSHYPPHHHFKVSHLN